MVIERGRDGRDAVDQPAPLRPRRRWQSRPSLLSEVASIALLFEKVIPFLDGAVKKPRARFGSVIRIGIADGDQVLEVVLEQPARLGLCNWGP